MKHVLYILHHFEMIVPFVLMKAMIYNAKNTSV